MQIRTGKPQHRPHCNHQFQYQNTAKSTRAG